MSSESSEEKILATDIYQQIYKELKINPRTIQWYATEGYIPKPEKIGGEAVYAPTAQIVTRVRVIQTLQKRYEIKLKAIKEIVDKQIESNWEDIQNLLTALEESFPYIEFDYEGNEVVSDKGAGIAKIVCSTLKTVSVESISLADAEELFDKQQEGPRFDSTDEIPF